MCTNCEDHKNASLFQLFYVFYRDKCFFNGDNKEKDPKMDFTLFSAESKGHR